MRVGISHGGPVIALVFGDVNCEDPKLQFDIISPVCNLASRLEHHAPLDGILVCPTFYNRCKDDFIFDEGKIFDIKGVGKCDAYVLRGKQGIKFEESTPLEPLDIESAERSTAQSNKTPLQSPPGSGEKKKLNKRSLSEKLKSIQNSLSLPRNKTVPEEFVSEE